MPMPKRKPNFNPTSTMQELLNAVCDFYGDPVDMLMDALRKRLILEKRKLSAEGLMRWRRLLKAMKQFSPNKKICWNPYLK